MANDTALNVVDLLTKVIALANLEAPQVIALIQSLKNQHNLTDEQVMSDTDATIEHADKTANETIADAEAKIKAQTDHNPQSGGQA